MIERIQSLARKFTDLTQFEVRRCNLMEWQAREWLNAGLTEDDLELVVKYIRKKVEIERIRQAMLHWSFLIGNVVRFEEELQEAKAVKRNHRSAPSDRERVLHSTGRPTDHCADSSKMVRQVLSEAGQKALEDFKAFRRTLE